MSTRTGSAATLHQHGSGQKHESGRLSIGRLRSSREEESIPGPQFLAGDTIPRPRDSLQTLGVDGLATTLAFAVRATLNAVERAVDFLEHARRSEEHTSELQS